MKLMSYVKSLRYLGSRDKEPRIEKYTIVRDISETDYLDHHAKDIQI